MINRLLTSMRPADWVVLFLISLMLSACGVFGASYVAGEGYPVYALWEQCVFVAWVTLLVMVFLAFIDYACTKAINKTLMLDYLGGANFVSTNTSQKKSLQARRIFERLTPKWTRKSILIFASVMAILWLPWYIANYPGGTYWDTVYQMYQIIPENHPIAIIPWGDAYNRTLTDAWMVDHHPILTTMVFGLFGWVSDTLTGNWLAGVALYTALQGILHVIVLSAVVAYMRKIGCPAVLNFIAYAFFAISPFIITWGMCMVKDTMFGLDYVVYFMFLIEAVRTKGAVFDKRRNIVFFVLLALGLCLTKKTGVYVVVFTTIIALIAYRKIKSRESHEISVLRKTLIGHSVLCLLVVCLVLPVGLFPLMNVEKGGRQEALGPMLQQTARYIVDYGDEVTPEEKEVLSKLVTNYDKFKSEYKFNFQDSVKFEYNLDTTNEQLLDYFKVYVAQGLKHPDAYFGAIAGVAGYYVSPTSFINIRMVTVDTHLGKDRRYLLWNPDGVLKDMRLGFDEAYKFIGNIPLLNILILCVTYDFWIPSVMFYLIFRHRKCLKNFNLHPGILIAPFVILLAFCIIAPVFDARYIIPIFDAAPLLIMGAITCIIVAIKKTREPFLARFRFSSERALPPPTTERQVSQECQPNQSSL